MYLNQLLSKGKNLNSSLSKQRKELACYWITIMIGYGLRTVIQLLYGHYYLFIKHFFWRWMLYFTSCPLLDIPNILYVFYVHYVKFQDAQQNSDIIDTKTDMDSTSAITESVDEGGMELLRMHIQINFHEL